jgi:methionyl aminopeptidase
MGISIKGAKEINSMRKAGHVVSVLHQRVSEIIQPGITTLDIDIVARDVLTEFGAGAAFLGHQGFPGRVCVSVNEQIVHGIPSRRVLNNGDIISVDFGAIIDGYYGDSAWTYAVGDISDEAKNLLRITERSLELGLEQARAGNRLGAIGHAIEKYVRAEGGGLIQEYGGHGIGRSMWEEPHVSNHGSADKGPQLRPGMALAIEPMVTTGGDETRQMPDGWTVNTADGSLAAHFEHTIVITNGAPEILTKRLAAVVH